MSIENSARGLVETLKKIAVNAVATTYPTEIRVGTVVSVSPLQIKVSEKMILDSEFLIIGESFAQQSYWVKTAGKEERVSIHNGLSVGDIITLIRAQGGQKFMLHSRISKMSGLRLIGDTTEVDTMMEALRALTNQSLDYRPASGEVILDGKPDNGTDKPIGTELIHELIRGYKVVRITEMTGKTDPDGYPIKGDITIADNRDYVKPNSATVYLKLNEDTVDEPLKIRMAHELIHARRITRGESLFVPGLKRYEQPMGYYFRKVDGADVKDFLPLEELETTGIPYYYSDTPNINDPFDVIPKGITENAIRDEHDLPERKEYPY